MHFRGGGIFMLCVCVRRERSGKTRNKREKLNAVKEAIRAPYDPVQEHDPFTPWRRRLPRSCLPHACRLAGVGMVGGNIVEA